MNDDRVPLRHSLLTRLLVTSILIAVAAITATAWLAVSTATQALNQEQGRAFADDKGVYDMLVGYAATHTTWSDVSDQVRARGVETGRRITLMTEDRVVIADSYAGPSLSTAHPSAVVDPLSLDLSLTGETKQIDDRVVGPYLVPHAERPALREAAERQLTCLGKLASQDGTVQQPPDDSVPVVGRIEETPGGRPAVVPEAVVTSGFCGAEFDALVSSTERAALDQLGVLTARCLNLADRAHLLQIRPDLTVYLAESPVTRMPGEQVKIRYPEEGSQLTTVEARACVVKALQIQLQPYVAPRALLFVTTPDAGTSRTTFTLSTSNLVRIIAVTSAVLLTTIAVTLLVGRRLVHPLRVLTESAVRQAPAAVTTKDEIGHLARALNDSAGRRDLAESQRQAMVNDVTHELRTPLSNIRTWLEAAQDDLAPTDAQLLGLLHEEALLLQHIIDDLGDLAAADAGMLRIHTEPVYVRDVLTQVVDGHRGTAHAAGVRLRLDIAGDPVLPADQARLRQLVGNLVSNAIRHTPPGGDVTVVAHDTTITVQDTGVGISAGDLPRIFDRFWRADQSRSRATGGSGLGLAIARQLAEAHGGTIGVQSEPDRGTLFTIRLPGT
ncbi:sensor histidine kinase [Micromonospora sp. LOL_024]|uniref:sensor histidine kinase n=1 Tax=Micromonospora sp. LOL_024 TaxID=3345412 RepID=UPI003A84EEC8